MKRKIILVLSAIIALTLSIGFFASCDSSETPASRYEVSFNTEGGSTIESQYVESGSTATKPADPTKEDYKFNGWYLGEEEYDFSKPVNNPLTLVAKWVAVVFYDITWKNEDGTTLSTSKVAEGTTPAYTGETPEKAATAQYTFVFNGWTPAIAEATANASYTATYSETVNTYDILWQNYDGTLLYTSDDVPYGTLPEYAGATPVKASNAQYSYTHNGWTPAVETVKGNTTYTATFEETTNEYNVKFMNGEDVLASGNYAYGATPAYTGETPVKAADNTYSYSFTGWDKDIAAVTGDETYYAQFSSTYIDYTITFVFDNGSENSVATYHYNEDVVVPADPAKASTAQYSFAFNGWTPEVSLKALADATYTANYTETVNTYDILWKNHDGTLLYTSENVAYGETPTYGGETPEKAEDESVYYFSGWTPEVGTVTGEATYTATYSSLLKATLFGGATPDVDMSVGANLTLSDGHGVTDGASLWIAGEPVEFSVEGNTLTIESSDLTALKLSGEQTVVIKADKYYSGSLLLISKVITTVAELQNLYTYTDYTTTNASEGGGSFNNYGGYFVLGNDIDCTGVTFSAAHGNAVQGTLNNTYQVQSGGFYGTFDGRGYAIQHASFWAGGLFGEVGQATIKNVRFVDASVNYAWGVTNGMLGQNIAQALITDCYFDVKIANFPESNNWTNASSVLAGWTYYGATIKNCVFEIDDSGTNNGGFPLIRNEGASWNGVQGPYITEGVLVIYKNDSTSIIARESGLVTITPVERLISVDKTNVDYTLGEYATISVTNSLGTPEYVVDNNSVVITDNQISSNSSGQVTVYAKWTFFVNNTSYVYRTNNEVTIQFAHIVDKTDFTKSYEIYSLTNSNANDEYVLTLTDEDKTTLGLAADATLGTLTLKDKNSVSYTLAYSDGYTISKSSSAENYIPAGEYTAILDMDGQILFKVLLATKIITTAEELQNLYTYTDYTTTKASEGEGSFYNYGGYFVLGNNIDCTGITFSAAHGNAVQGSLNNTYQVQSGGFFGTFDGRGYEIQHASFWAGGLFGEVGQATIKNVRFVDASVLYAWGVTDGMLGQNVTQALITDCYFDVKLVNYPGSNNWTNASSVLAAWTYYGARITNCVFVIDASGADNGGFPLIRNHGGSWNGVQGPEILTNVTINGVLQDNTTPDF